MRKVFRQVSFDPPFELERDFGTRPVPLRVLRLMCPTSRRAEMAFCGIAKMDLDKEGKVSYDEFELWFKVATHDDDPDVPVLPE